jgi:hypothetical protein
MEHIIVETYGLSVMLVLCTEGQWEGSERWMNSRWLGWGGGQLPHSVETGGSSHVSLIESSPRLMQAKSMKCSPGGWSHVCMSTSGLNTKPNAGSQTARYHKSEDYNMYLHCHENLKYDLYVSSWGHAVA